MIGVHHHIFTAAATAAGDDTTRVTRTCSVVRARRENPFPRAIGSRGLNQPVGSRQASGAGFRLIHRESNTGVAIRPTLPTGCAI